MQSNLTIFNTFGIFINSMIEKYNKTYKSQNNTLNYCIFRPPTGRSTRKSSVTFSTPLFLKSHESIRRETVSASPETSRPASAVISPVPPASRRSSVAMSQVSKISSLGRRSVKSTIDKNHEEAAAYATEVHGIKVSRVSEWNLNPLNFIKNLGLPINEYKSSSTNVLQAMEWW